ncbi:MAG: hypothetical protein KDI36_02005 [Pseudomonadales bacterium]|nr:hypothetical protein [Pseudomonadales bacterium]
MLLCRGDRDMPATTTPPKKWLYTGALKQPLLTWVLVLSAPFIAIHTEAGEWEEIPETEYRIRAPVADKSTAQHLPPDVYQRGDGEITGAFGFEFGQLPDPAFITGRPGWIEPGELPEDFTYFGFEKPLKMNALQLVPPLVPVLFKGMTVSYRCFTDFHGYPVWIEAQTSHKLPDLVEILSRKYGKPTIQAPDILTFTDGTDLIRLDAGKGKTLLSYFDTEGLGNYLKARNLSLRRKYEGERGALTPSEQEILALADQLTNLRKNIDAGFGIPFKQRIHFRAKPDQYVPFDPPQPIKGLGAAVYKIMVSPDLIPIMIRMEIYGKEPYLQSRKVLLDQALDLAFGGFLKNSAMHTVVSLQGNSISVLIRGETLSLTLLDGYENKLANERSREREAEQRRQAQTAQRRTEIKAERGL